MLALHCLPASQEGRGDRTRWDFIHCHKHQFLSDQTLLCLTSVVGYTVALTISLSKPKAKGLLPFIEQAKAKGLLAAS